MKFSTKLISSIAAVSFLTTGVAFAFHTTVEFEADLQGSSEVPPVSTTMNGEASLDFNSDNSQVVVKLSVNQAQNLTGAHIHCAAAGVNGPVVASLYGTSSSEVSDITVIRTIMAGQLENASCTPVIASISDLRAAAASGNLYVNVHNQAYPNGAIRGQLMATHEDDDDDGDDSGSDLRAVIRARIRAIFERIFDQF